MTKNQIKPYCKLYKEIVRKLKAAIKEECERQDYFVYDVHSKILLDDYYDEDSKLLKKVLNDIEYEYRFKIVIYPIKLDYHFFGKTNELNVGVFFLEDNNLGMPLEDTGCEEMLNLLKKDILAIAEAYSNDSSITFRYLPVSSTSWGPYIKDIFDGLYDDWTLDIEFQDRENMKLADWTIKIKRPEPKQREDNITRFIKDCRRVQTDEEEQPVKIKFNDSVKVWKAEDLKEV